mmetsp:Transcript_37915/g.105504  ORF Transcript_37915/g.105504 Transcript_37915/m.105504 type:complete len:308 (+) Transcript_37915:169-1092(+)
MLPASFPEGWCTTGGRSGGVGARRCAPAVPAAFSASHVASKRACGTPAPTALDAELLLLAWLLASEPLSPSTWCCLQPPAHPPLWPPPPAKCALCVPCRPVIMMPAMKLYTTVHAISTSGVNSSPKPSRRVRLSASNKIPQCFFETLYRAPSCLINGTNCLRSCRASMVWPRALMTSAKSLRSATDSKLHSPGASSHSQNFCRTSGGKMSIAEGDSLETFRQSCSLNRMSCAFRRSQLHLTAVFMRSSNGPVSGAQAPPVAGDGGVAHAIAERRGTPVRACRGAAPVEYPPCGGTWRLPRHLFNFFA